MPLHAGAPEYSVWLAKRAGLASWLGIGAAAFAVFAGLTISAIADNWSPSVRVVLLPSVMCVVLAAEAAAIISARARGAAGELPTEPAPEPGRCRSPERGASSAHGAPAAAENQ